MQVLWLRYLTEINEHTEEVSADLMAHPEIRKAVTALEESAFSKEQLLGYEKFWDIVNVEKTLFNSGERKGHEEGKIEGKYTIALKMKQLGIDTQVIAQCTRLTVEEIGIL